MSHQEIPLSAIHEDNLLRIVLNSPVIDHGVDSSVYRFENWAIHAFYANISPMLVFMLARATEEASGILSGVYEVHQELYNLEVATIAKVINVTLGIQSGTNNEIIKPHTLVHFYEGTNEFDLPTREKEIPAELRRQMQQVLLDQSRYEGQVLSEKNIMRIGPHNYVLSDLCDNLRNLKLR